MRMVLRGRWGERRRRQGREKEKARVERLILTEMVMVVKGMFQGRKKESPSHSPRAQSQQAQK